MGLAAGGLLLGKSGGSGSSGSPTALQRKLPLVQRRVESIRGLRFRRRLAPLLVSGGQARRAGLADLDRVEPPATQAADQEVLQLLGLIPSGSSLRDIQGSILQEQVAGYYDTHSKRLALVRDATAGSPAIGEIALAHELTHALDDQTFGIHDVSPATNDRSLAYTALLEGDATLVMSRYAQSYVSGTGLLGAALSAGGSSGGATKLPRFVESSLEFPYLTGEAFVGALYGVARGWKLVNFAMRHRPPVSTEQVMHPLKYEADERPLRVRLNVGPSLPGWRRAMSSTLGEFVTGQLLQRGVQRDHAERAAAGWGGDAFELWTSGPRSALVIAWRWDTPADAAEFERALRAVKFASPSAVQAHGGVVTLALAPMPELAQALSTTH